VAVACAVALLKGSALRSRQFRSFDFAHGKS
jgi:hypothetical protein